MKLTNNQNKSLSANQLKEILCNNLSFAATEQYKLLRTNLNFTLPQQDKCYVIGMTSPMRAEGNSTTAVNLSYVMAESGKRVALIDCDLRIPSIAKKMNVDGDVGITDLLLGKQIEIDAFKSELLDNWYIIPSGEIPPNPSELLGSARMENLLDNLKEQFDYIIVDLPPVNLVSDALSISRFISGLIVVICQDATSKKEADSCFQQIEFSGAKILGCVINESRDAGEKHSRRNYYNRYNRSRRYGYGMDYSTSKETNS